MAKIIITIILIDIVITIIKDDYSLIWEQALIELWTLVFLFNTISLNWKTQKMQINKRKTYQ